MLIRGDRLNERQCRQVLAAFVHRWTHENKQQTYRGKCPACVQHKQYDGKPTVNGKPWHEYHAPLTSDNEWLKAHAFYFTKDGSRLSLRHKHCEPAYIAD